MIRALRSVLRFRHFDRDPNRRRLSRCADIDDLRTLAHKRLPRGVFDYVDGAAERETTADNNVRSFTSTGFRPRVLTGLGEIDIDRPILGKPAAFPLILAPTGFTRIVHPDGELAVVRAAARAGLPYTLSTLATRSIEEVAAAAPDADRWFQLYVWRDRSLVRELIERAKNADYRVLCVTVDTAVLGRRQRDHRRGFTLPPKIGLDTVVDGLLHPGWTWNFIRSDPITFANVRGRGVGDGSEAVALSEYVSSQFDHSLSWSDIEWFREQWEGPIVLKGIQTSEDAALAAKVEVDGIALSNHGGRQLDGAPSPISILPGIADQVGADLEIYCDGGIRSGADIVKAGALGASAAMSGRAYLYALGAAGELGVDWMLSRFNEDIKRTLSLIGVPSFTELNRSHIQKASVDPLAT